MGLPRLLQKNTILRNVSEDILEIKVFKLSKCEFMCCLSILENVKNFECLETS